MERVMQAGRPVVLAAVLVLAGYGAWSAWTDATGVFAQEPPQPQAAELHEQMHGMMDAMMGEGASERMHEAMPGSEQMMEQCAQMMTMMSSMDGMMGDGMMSGGMGGMSGGMGGMMGRGADSGGIQGSRREGGDDPNMSQLRPHRSLPSTRSEYSAGPGAGSSRWSGSSLPRTAAPLALALRGARLGGPPSPDDRAGAGSGWRDRAGWAPR